MKKLALALVCLLSVAFFASCTPEITNPEPSIAVKTGEGYISDGAILNLDTEYKLGIMAASNTQTMKELANFRMEVKIFSMEGLEVDSYDSTWLINGSEFEYEETWSFGEAKDLVGTATITATVTDVAGKFNSVKLDISLNQPAQPLIARTFEWYRLGNTITGLEEFGLWWDRNLKATHAQIKPLDGAKLFIFDAEDWDAITTDVDKAVLFATAIENDEAVTLYDGINTDVAGDQDYDDVIGTITADGELYLIHITHYNRGTFVSQGYPYTITGEVK